MSLPSLCSVSGVIERELPHQGWERPSETISNPSGRENSNVDLERRVYLELQVQEAVGRAYSRAVKDLWVGKKRSLLVTLATTGEWIHWLDTLGVVTVPLCAKQNTCIMVALKQVSRGSGSFTNEFFVGCFNKSRTKAYSDQQFLVIISANCELCYYFGSATCSQSLVCC